MKITSKITALIDPGRRDAAHLLRQLRPGQVLQANVIDSPRAGITRLQIGVAELLAKTRIPLQRGTPLTLSVSRLGKTPELQVLQASGLMRPEQYLLRKALPQQISIGEALNALGRTLGNDDNALPEAIRKAAYRLLNRVLDPSSLNPTRIKDQFLNSGLFLETLLARQGQAVKGDMKLDLLLLLRNIQTLLASNQAAKHESDPAQRVLGPTNVAATVAADKLLERLMQLLNGALARINTHQAISLAQEVTERPVWQFDLPLLVNGQLEEIWFRVERENDAQEHLNGEQQGTRWTATLRFDFASTGRIQVNLAVQKGCVSSTFWCERANTEQRIGAQLPRLEKAMANAGLQVGSLAARHGSPPNQLGLPTLDEALIDDHA